MTEHEKLLAGLEYDYTDPEIQSMLARTQELLVAYNAEKEPARRGEILRDMLGSCGDNVTVQPPASVLYGKHTSIGHDVFINGNCTIQDSALVTIGDRVDIEFDIPSRGIIGLRTNVLTASAGEAIMAHRFKEYQPYKGDIERRSNGSMIAMETGTAFAYAIDKLQDRGRFFIYPQEEVYAGQVVGEHVHENDLVINVTKSKKLTNMRASGSDDKARIIPPVIFSLEEALEYIKEDEYVEVTPKSMRMRKVILDETERKRANKN